MNCSSCSNSSSQKGTLECISKSPECSLYEALNVDDSPVKKFVFSSAESRIICNDPFFAGINYTSALRQACSRAITLLSNNGKISLTESQTVVMHILRGGLNFGLREAVGQALSFNNHASAFISAQRARRQDDPESWIITESNYQKLSLKKESQVVLGDVVATGTSLEHALGRLLKAAQDTSCEISSILFFTIGGPRSHELLANIDKECRKKFPSYKGASVVYFEGIFEVATNDTPMHIKIDGTDLIRRGSLMAPEFMESQYENPAYPLERCTIYDAGSRAFDFNEYIGDVHEYWEQTLQLAKKGMTFVELVKERFPELTASRFGDVNLLEVCEKQVKHSKRL